jgi:hypothetical protein
VNSSLTHQGDRLLGWGGHRLFAGGDEFLEVFDAKADVLADPGAADRPGVATSRSARPVPSAR